MYTVSLILLIVGAVISLWDYVTKETEYKPSKKVKKTRIIIGVIMIISGAGVAGIKLYNTNRDENIKRKFAELQSDRVSKYPIVRIFGDAVTEASNRNGKVEFVLGDTKAPTFQAKVENQKLLVDYVLRDSKGITLAIIRDNVVEIKESCKDCQYNYDDQAYEIISADDAVLWQMEFIFDEVYVTGFLGYPPDERNHGGGYYMKSLANHPNHSGLIYVEKGADFTRYGTDVRKLFRYPRELHFRERN
ncbi:hypothetical protein [Foetidibacter luteolus]|uniref:hypothetical protein n=1 Tax=Foetidibacter luteolus TaxID=2608880 RepID=UPI00129ADB03|nr:hypothetical protein [Foetidibacter luteolus]